MKELRFKKREDSSWVYSWPFLGLLLVITLLLARGTWQVWQKERQTGQNLDLAEERVRGLSEREERLKEENQWLLTEEGRLEELRERYNVVREGEEVVVLVSPSEEGSEVPVESRPWYKRLWSAMIGE